MYIGKFLYSAVSSPQDRSKRFNFTSLTDLFTQTPSRLLWEASSRMLQLMCEGCSYTYPPMSIVRYSFIQLSELEQCRVKKAQVSKLGSRSRECKALPLSYCALLRCDSVVRHIASLFVNIRLFVCFISQRCVVNKCSSLTVQGSGLLSRWRQHDLNLLLHECVR